LLFLPAFFVVLIVPIWWESGSLFRHLGQNDDLSFETQVFLRALIPAGLLQVIAECLKKFLQVQNHSGPVSWCIGIGAAIGTVMNFVLVLQMELGVLGAAISHAIYFFVTIVAMVAYMASNAAAREYWGGFTWRAFQDPWRFIILAISGLLTVATEFWW
jgi:multidrug resistance protein, MATE family